MKRHLLIVFLFGVVFSSCKKQFKYCKDTAPKAYESTVDLKSTITKEAKLRLVKKRYQPKIDSIFEIENSLANEGYILTKEQMLNIASAYIDFKIPPTFYNAEKNLAHVCLSVNRDDISYQKLDKAFQPKKIETYIPITATDNMSKAKMAAIDKLIEVFPNLKNLNRAGLHLLFHKSKLTINDVMGKDGSGAWFEGEVYPIVVEAIESGDYIIDDGSKISAGLAGKDDKGLTAIFQIIVLSDRYNWKFADTRSIENLQTGNRTNIYAPVQSPALRSNLKNLLDVISIGTASCEGDVIREFNRSKKRAYVMAELIDDYYGQDLDLPIQTLSLGKFNGNCTNNTAYQRKVVLVGTTYKETNVNIEQALKNMLRGHRSPLEVDKYSNFELRPYTDIARTLTAYSE